MRVAIKDLVGENCLTVDDGQKIYDIVHPALAGGETVEIDFTGATVFASPFFNAAIGQLLKDLSPESLNRLLVMRGLSANGAFVVRKVIENSKEYYSDQRLRSVVDGAGDVKDGEP